MKFLIPSFVLCCLFPMTRSIGSAAEPTRSRPNILFVLADDLGWSDLGCYGHPWHETPNLDKLAQAGMKFTRAYAPAPICSASRASILTGKTPARLHFEFVTKNEPGVQQIEGETLLQTPPFTLNLPLEERTLPEHLNDLGYLTAFFGKWHLNAYHKRYLGWSPTHGPKQQGFQIAEEDFGGHPYSWQKKPPKPILTDGDFPADSMIDRARAFLKEDHDKPFFLMVSMFYVHTPVKTECQWLLDRYDILVPTDSPNRKQRIAYAAFVETLDREVGRLLETLEAMGKSDESLVVFTSDNGGHPEYTANGPLRGSKWNLYEGGIRVPLIMRWPGIVPAGSTSETPVIGYDLMPTFVAIAGGIARSVDGHVIAPLFRDPEWNPERELIWHFPYYHPERGYAPALEQIGIDDFAVSKTRPASAILSGDRKLLTFYETDRAELYKLSSDPGEQHDLSHNDPALVNRLRERLHELLQNANARLPVKKLP